MSGYVMHQQVAVLKSGLVNQRLRLTQVCATVVLSLLSCRNDVCSLVNQSVDEDSMRSSESSLIQHQERHPSIQQFCTSHLLRLIGN